VPGAASHSYGIHVARLAGMPADVVARSKEILAHLENAAGGRRPRFAADLRSSEAQPMQMGLFAAVENRLRDELSRLDPSRMTPIEALNMLHKLAEEAKK
jgi:DNA mismatch repair protein MutS